MTSVRSHTSRRSARILTLVLSLTLTGLACSVGAAEPTVTPPPDLSATARIERATAEQATEQAVATEAAGATGTAVEQAAASATAAVNQTATAASRATETAAARRATREAATAQAVIAMTEQARPLQAIVQKLADEGHLSKTDGHYLTLDDFDESWAQLGWYQFWDTDLDPVNFVFRTDARWESASNTADWWNSGCGVVFRLESADDHYFAHLGLDGWVYFTGFQRGNFFSIGRGYYNKVDIPDGGANLMLVVEGDKFTFFVNDERVYTVRDARFKTGNLALTLLSGTNRDFGTRCQMRNIEVWHVAD